VAGFCEHGNEPLGSIKKVGCYLTSWVTISFPKNILHHGVSNKNVIQNILLASYTSYWSYRSNRTVHSSQKKVSMKENAQYSMCVVMPKIQNTYIKNTYTELVTNYSMW